MPLAPQSNSSKTPLLMAFTRKLVLSSAPQIPSPYLKRAPASAVILTRNLPVACTITCTGDHSYTKSSTTSCSMSFAKTHDDPLAHQ